MLPTTVAGPNATAASSIHRPATAPEPADAKGGGVKPATVAAGLQSVTPPAVSVSEAQVRGAASFAEQLGALGETPIAADNLLAEFLKLGVIEDRRDIEYTQLLAQAQHLLAKLAIRNAQAIEALVGGSSGVTAALRTILNQIDRDVSRAVEELRELQQKSLQGKQDKKEEKDEKGVGAEEQQRRFGRSSLKGLSAAAAAEMSSTAAADGGLALTQMGADALRLGAAGAVSRLAGNAAALAGSRRCS